MPALALSIPGLPSPCSLPGINVVCHALGSAGKAVASDVLGIIAHAFATAAQHMIMLAVSFWTKVPLPQWDVNSGPVGNLQHSLSWVTGAIAVGCCLICAGRMALNRHAMPAADLLRGLLTLLFTTALAVPVVNLLGVFCDGFATWIVNQAGNSGTRLGGIGAGFAILDAPLAILLAAVAMFASVAQVALMVVRVAIVAILTGCLPMFAAASATKTGEQSFRRACGWLLAALLYSPAAAIIYASALWLTNTGTDVLGVISGLSMICLAVLALPALLRLVQPITAPAVAGGGGAGMFAGAAALAATGARMVGSSGGSSHSSDSSERSSSTPSGPSGSAGPAGSNGKGTAGSSGAAGSNGAAGASGATGATGGPGAAGAGAGASAGGAAGAAAGAAPVLVVAEVAKGAKSSAAGTVPSGDGHQN